MQTLAQSWLVLSLTSSAVALGLVSVFQFAPMLLFGMFAGVLADRVPKRSLLVTTQAIAMVLATILAVLVATDRVELWHVYALALGLGINNAFDMPARQAFVVDMVGRDDLSNAIALNSSLFNAARIVGPAIAGLLLATLGAAFCFGINAASYLAVIAGLLMMRITPQPSSNRGRGLTQLREGLNYVRRTPEILRPVMLVGLVATFGMNFNIWIPLLAKQDFDGGAGAFGLLMASSGAGSLIGALALAFVVRNVQRWMVFVAATSMGIFNLALALSGAESVAVPVAMGVLALVGLSSTSMMAMANTTVQTAAPDELRGRIMSVYMTVFAGTAPFGAVIAGLTADRFGAPVSVAVGGVVTLAAVATIAVWGQEPAVVRERLLHPRRRS